MYVKFLSLILANRFGSEILIMLDIKGQIWYYVHAHLKVSGWLSDLNALLNRKLPIFFFEFE